MPTLAQSINISKVASFQRIVILHLSQIRPIEKKQFASWGGSIFVWLSWLKRIAAENIQLVNGSPQTLSPRDAALRVNTSLRLKAGAINELTGLTFSWNPTTKMWQDTTFFPTFALPASFDIFGNRITGAGTPPPPIPIASLGLSPSAATIAAVEAGLAGPAPVPEVEVDAAPPIPVDQLPTSLVSSQATDIAPAKTFAQVAADSGSGPAPPAPQNIINPPETMAILATEEFRPASSTFLPTAGGPVPDVNPIFGIKLGPLAGLIGGALGTLIPIPGVGTAGGAALGTALFGGASTPPLGTPGIAPSSPTGAGNGGLQDALIKLLREFSPVGELGSVLDLAKTLGDTFGGALPRAPITDFPEGFAPGQGQINFPVNGALATTGLPIAPVLAARPSICFRAPKGYVVVEITGSDGTPQKVAMWKPLARSMKLFKSRPKPPISASEMKSLRTAKRVRNKSKKIATLSGFKCVNR